MILMKTASSGCDCASCSARCPSVPAAAQPPDQHAWLDRYFLHPRWGLVGSLAVFAGVLFVVFEVSVWLDAMTTARLAAAASQWVPESTTGVVAKGVLDGLIGLAGIVIPYMVPLLLLLVALEQAGIMPRIALVIDRAFHRIGLHGGVAVAFLTGLGCNVPAIANAAHLSKGRERVIATFLVTFVPCSARSAIVLAVAGKHLGGAGVFAIFAASVVVIALLGRVLSSRRQIDSARVHAIPPYAVPHWRALAAETWERSRDVLTIVTPLLVLGSVVLALLQHLGADRVVDALLAPVTAWWLGLPIALGVPLLFGVLRKELSLVIIFQALGTPDIGAVLDAVQLVTLLLFLNFYLPCISTFAVMTRTIGRRMALRSVGLSILVALLVSGAARWAMVAAGQLAAWAG
jgi:ferrous iron transport protein B